MTSRDERSGQKGPDAAQLERSGQKQQHQERGLEQQGHQGLPHQEGQASAQQSQTQQPKPTWGEQTPEMDQQRTIGGGGSSSDSDGQQLFDNGGPLRDEEKVRGKR